MSSDLKQRMLNFCDRESLLQPGGTVIVGLSGGADSVCLFRLLSDISKKAGISLVAVHVHHGIRGEEADRDERFASELADELGVPFESVRVDAPVCAKEKGLTLEEAARNLRHTELESIRSERGAYAVALAHHKGDQVETVLMNIFRGTSPVGLCGMEAKKDHIIRPLLFATKEEILSYLSENNYSYVEDSTNSDTNYSRNMIRNILIPQIEKEYPGASNHIAALASDMVNWRDFIIGETDKLMEDHQHTASEKTLRVSEPEESSADSEELQSEVRIPVVLYRGQPKGVQGELIRRSLDALMPGMKDIGRTHYDMIHRLFMSDSSGKSVNLPKNLIVVRDYTSVVFKWNTETGFTIPEPVDLVVPGVTEISVRGEKIVLSSEIIDIHTFNKKKHDFFQEKDYTKCIDYGKIEDSLVLRTWDTSDYMILPDGGRKLLSRVYIDEKVPRADRVWQVVVADGAHAVWALPDRLSHKYYVTDGTKEVLVLTRLLTDQMEE